MQKERDVAVDCALSAASRVQLPLPPELWNFQEKNLGEFILGWIIPLNSRCCCHPASWSACRQLLSRYMSTEILKNSLFKPRRGFLSVQLLCWAGILQQHRTHGGVVAARRLQGENFTCQNQREITWDLWLLFLYSSHLIFSVPWVFYNAMIYHGRGLWAQGFSSVMWSAKRQRGEPVGEIIFFSTVCK